MEKPKKKEGVVQSSTISLKSYNIGYNQAIDDYEEYLAEELPEDDKWYFVSYWAINDKDGYCREKFTIRADEPIKGEYNDDECDNVGRRSLM